LCPSAPSSPKLALAARGGEHIGDYEVLEEIARGGMGVIYKARQVSLNRIVALKMVLSGQLAHAADLLRFHTEAQAIAQLHHPNLVSIFEIGEHDGLPFFSMEYLEGGPLSRRLHGRPLAPRDAAHLLLPLVQAIEYAHSRGIVHRDLKPGNILLSSPAPLGECVAKITDFGIAKQLGETSQLTRTGEVLGTPSYMAPEQAMGKQIGAAADVYSLGAILYEALTGVPPFTASDSAGTLLRVVHDEPTSPRERNPAVPVDLATICLKCLEKEPARRYASAGSLAEDLRRFLAHEPILARAASPWERVSKRVKRNPVKATIAAASVLLAVVAVGALVSFWREAEDRARVEADMRQARDRHLVEAQALLADALLERGIAMAEKQDVRRGLHWMLRSLKIAETVGDQDPRGPALAEAARYNLAHWGEQAARPGRDLPHPHWAWTVDLSPDGRFAVTGCRDARVRVWDARTGSLIGSPLVQSGPVWAVLFHPSGKFLFGAGGDEKGEIRAFRESSSQVGTFAPLGEAATTQSAIARLGVSPDGNHLFALSHTGDLWLFAFDAGVKPALRPVPALTVSGVVGAAFSPDSKTLYYARRTGTVAAFDVHRQAEARARWQATEQVKGPLTALAVASDGRRLAVSSFDTTAERSAVHLWDLAGDHKHLKVSEWPGAIKGLVFSPDGQRLAARLLRKERGGFLGQIRLIELEGQVASEVCPPIEHPQPVWSMAFHPSGQHLISGCEDRHSRIIEVATGKLMAPPVGHVGNVTNVAISADGRRAITACSGASPYAWAKIQELPRWHITPKQFGPPRPLHQVQWQDKDRALFAIDEVLAVLELEPVRGRILRTVVAPPPPNHVRWFAQPRHLVNYRADGKMTLTDLTTKKALFTLAGVPEQHDAHGSQVAGRILVYDRKKKRLTLHPFADPARRPFHMELRYPTSNFFVHDNPPVFGVPIFGGPVPTFRQPDVAQRESTGNVVTIWSTEGAVLRTWKFPHPIDYATLSPRGDVLALYGANQTQFFDVATGRRIGQAVVHGRGIMDRCFHPSGNVAVFGQSNGTIFLWHIPSSKPIGRAIQHDGDLRFVSPRPDGSGFLSGSANRRAIAWPHLGPKAGSLAELKRWVEDLTGMTLNDKDDLTPLDDTPR
jgi:WD40 repeat protein